MQCFSSFDCCTQCGPFTGTYQYIFAVFFHYSLYHIISKIGHYIEKHLKLHKALTYLNGVVSHKRAPHVSLAGLLPPGGALTSEGAHSNKPGPPRTIHLQNEAKTVTNPPVLGPHESVLTAATGGATVEAYISFKSTKQYGQAEIWHCQSKISSLNPFCILCAEGRTSGAIQV